MFTKNKMVFADAMPEKGIYCVYLLVCDEKGIVYVGQSSNLNLRIRSHISSDKKFDRFEYQICDADSSDEIECENIVKHNPVLNKKLPSTKKYVSLGLLKSRMIENIHNKIDALLFSLPRVFDRGEDKSKNFKYITEHQASTLIEEFNELLITLQKGNK